jgi:hypothetical protein
MQRRTVPLTHTHKLSLSLSNTHIHTHTHTYTHTQTLTLALTLKHTHTHTHTHTVTCTVLAISLVNKTIPLSHHTSAGECETKKNTKNDRVSCLSNVAAVSVILFKSFRLTRWWTIKLKFVSVKFQICAFSFSSRNRRGD